VEAIPENIVHVTDPEKRRHLVRALAAVPGLFASLQSAVSEGGFRVIMSAENAQFFRPNAAGLYSPHLHDGRSIVENIKLAKLPFDYAGLALGIIAQAQMALILQRVDAIHAACQRTGNDVRDALRDKVKGGIWALRHAQSLNDPVEARKELLAGCSAITRDLAPVFQQLRTSIAAMPLEETGSLRDGSATRLRSRKLLTGMSKRTSTRFRLGATP